MKWLVIGSLVVVGVLLGLALLLSTLLPTESGSGEGVFFDVSTCEEDEVIDWVGVDTRGCVHYEQVVSKEVQRLSEVYPEGLCDLFGDRIKFVSFEVNLDYDLISLNCYID